MTDAICVKISDLPYLFEAEQTYLPSSLVATAAIVNLATSI